MDRDHCSGAHFGFINLFVFEKFKDALSSCRFFFCCFNYVDIAYS